MSDNHDGRDFGKWLREMCQNESLSLRDAGQRVGLSHSTIRDIANGTTPTPATVKKLAIAFGGDNVYGKEALEDTLLILAGHRTPRPEKDISEPVARLLDIISQFSEPQLVIMARFAKFLSDLEAVK